MTDQQARPLRLRELREERGWTQQDTADQLARLAWLRNSKRVGVNADMVAKWERGAKGVSSLYRDLLCLLFGVTAEYLGLGPMPTKTSASKGDWHCPLWTVRSSTRSAVPPPYSTSSALPAESCNLECLTLGRTT